ncbi:hypothetical protein L3Y34_015705 [Caenorhabditis briggsae]|uniref:Uncharacterized protein n=1 Tax=Caenorhabditis briggsae TaxID=6238 RepID=A0AAE9DW74_CAEBR|nr:hypothetical protein L3Y34_015705 [Caenorhabditis briggsae]
MTTLIQFGRISNRNREIGMKVDLTTKVLCLKASIHFLIISNLHFLLAFALTIASVYTYFTCPSDLFGMPVPPEDVKKTKEDLIIFLYKSPEPAPRVHRRFSVKRREDVEEDVDETGPDEHEKEGNREEVKKTDGSEKKKNDNEEEMKKTTETGDQTGTGTGAD